MTALTVLDAIEIAAPCHASWEDMKGSDRLRFCGLCQKNVYNLSAMTRAEAVDLIEAAEGRFCGRLFRRADGTVLTADCPVGLKEQARRAARRAFAAGLYLVVMVVLGALSFFAGRSLAGGDRCDVAVDVSTKAADRLLGPAVLPEATDKDYPEMGEPMPPDVEMGKPAAPGRLLGRVKVGKVAR